jgi:protein-disulfide isomerase
MIARRLALALIAAGLSGSVLASSAFGAAAPSALTAKEVVLGNPNAKVTVVEWASITCPHCARFNAEVYPAFKKKYVDSGQVKYVFREMLTEPAQIAAAGFMIARCAGKDKYFDVVDSVFRGQEQMYKTGDAKTALFNAGKAGGLTDEQIDACIKEPANLAAMNERLKQAVEVDKIEATPTFEINGKRLEGVQSLAQLDAVIQPLLKK